MTFEQMRTEWCNKDAAKAAAYSREARQWREDGRNNSQSVCELMAKYRYASAMRARGVTETDQFYS